MQKVVLDTNALLMPFEFKINVDLELKGLLGDYEAYVPGPAIGELKRSKSKFASVALKLAGKYKRYETAIQGDERRPDDGEAAPGRHQVHIPAVAQPPVPGRRPALDQRPGRVVRTGRQGRPRLFQPGGHDPLANL